jgi:hypothetical protein
MSSTISTNLFDPELLKSGDEEVQLYNWQHAPNNSIFVRWVPDELLPNAEYDNPPDLMAREFFSQFGIVSRIDFVPKFNANKKQSGHMAFIHYDHFYAGSDEVNSITRAYPEAAAFEWTSPLANKYGAFKTYTLKCCVNTRPIPKVEFNNSQLTDMIHNLNKRLTDELETFKFKYAALDAENKINQNEILKLRARIAYIDLKVQLNTSGPTEYPPEETESN